MLRLCYCSDWTIPSSVTLPSFISFAVSFNIFYKAFFFLYFFFLQLLQSLFKRARAAAPSLIFFDEIDALAGKRLVMLDSSRLCWCRLYYLGLRILYLKLWFFIAVLLLSLLYNSPFLLLSSLSSFNITSTIYFDYLFSGIKSFQCIFLFRGAAFTLVADAPLLPLILSFLFFSFL